MKAVLAGRVSVVLAVSTWFPSPPPTVVVVAWGLKSDSRCVLLAGEKTGAKAGHVLIKNQFPKRRKRKVEKMQFSGSSKGRRKSQNAS